MNPATAAPPNALADLEDDALVDNVLEAESASMVAYLTAECEKQKRMTRTERADARAALVARACGDAPLTAEPYYTADDVRAWLARADEMECAEPRTGAQTLVDLYTLKIRPNAIYRERFDFLAETTGLTLTEVAKRVGLTDNQPTATAVAELRRMLGIAPKDRTDRLPVLALFVSYEWAVKLADALDLTYVDCGV